MAGGLRGLEFCLGDVKLLASAAVAAAAEFLSGTKVESDKRSAADSLSGGELRQQSSVKDESHVYVLVSVSHLCCPVCSTF